MVVLLAMLLLQVISLIGLYHLTQFSFNNKRVGDTRSIELSNNALLFTKVTVVLQWIMIGLTVLALGQKYI
jgi:hypothetical protein